MDVGSIIHGSASSSGMLAFQTPEVGEALCPFTKDENSRENILTISVFIFLFGNETEKLGQKNEIGYAGYRKRYNSIRIMSITVGNRYSKAGITNYVTPSNV